MLTRKIPGGINYETQPEYDETFKLPPSKIPTVTSEIGK